VPLEHWADVGGALGQRLAWLVEPAPPYYALYGAVSAGLLSTAAAEQVARLWPTHASITSNAWQRPLEMRTTPHGTLDLTRPNRTPASTPTGSAETVLTKWFQRAATYLTHHASLGTLSAPGQEAGMARICWTLAQLEDAYRGGRLSEPLRHALERPDITAVDLHTLAPEPVIAELVELAALAHTTGTVQRWHDRGPGYAGPVFVHHWADGDLLVGPELIDVKTVIRADKPDRTARWIWQILLYAWLDTTNTWGINVVGLYLARHGLTISWGAHTLAGELLGDNNFQLIESTRREFLEVADRVIRVEGGTPPPSGEGRRPAFRDGAGAD
jgi:hypothetical protein